MSIPEITDAERERRERLEERAYALGVMQGSADALAWMDQPRSAVALRGILAGIALCDYDVIQEFPSEPLSGEFADNWTPQRLYAALDVAEYDHNADWYCSMFEDGYEVAVSQTIERACRAALTKGKAV